MAARKKKTQSNSDSNSPANGAGVRNGTAARRPRKQTAGRKRNGAGGSGNPKASFERYIALAQSAEANGDEIEAEGHYQHAEHFYRIMNDAAR